MKRPIGSQSSFSNLDGARASIASDDRLSISFERPEEVEVVEEEGTVSFPAASPEFTLYPEGEPEWLSTPWNEKPEWNESFDEWKMRYWGKYPPIGEDEIEAKWKKWKRQMKEEKEKEDEEKEEKNEFTDLTSTIGSSWNPTDPEVTTEPINEN